MWQSFHETDKQSYVVYAVLQDKGESGQPGLYTLQGCLQLPWVGSSNGELHWFGLPMRPRMFITGYKSVFVSLGKNKI